MINYFKSITLCVLIFFSYPSVLAAQSTKKTHEIALLKLKAVFGDTLLTLNSGHYTLQNGDSVQISTCRFYISHIQLFNYAERVWTDPQRVHLIDIEQPETGELPMNIPANMPFTDIEFQLGIDSLTHMSGVFGGDLDPMKGMYWAWQSGYINFKLEGKSPICPTRRNAFQFHIGGYAAPNNALQIVKLDVNRRKPLIIHVDIQKFLSHLDLKKQHTFMIPSLEAVDLAQLMASCFYTL